MWDMLPLQGDYMCCEQSCLMFCSSTEQSIPIRDVGASPAAALSGMTHLATGGTVGAGEALGIVSRGGCGTGAWR